MISKLEDLHLSGFCPFMALTKVFLKQIDPRKEFKE